MIRTSSVAGDVELKPGQKRPFVEPRLVDEASLVDVTLVSGGAVTPMSGGTSSDVTSASSDAHVLDNWIHSR
jgi:hypothetical protein